MIAISDFFIEWGAALAIIVLAAFLGIRYLLSQPAWQLRWHRSLFRIPVISKLVRGLNAALFTRTFSILSGSGVTIIDSMKIAAQVVTNLPMRQTMIAYIVAIMEPVIILIIRLLVLLIVLGILLPIFEMNQMVQ